eukprot:m.39614 g.39614  ORF g.39614 m.39614 type:complete len:351 (+) comp10335_c0_seq1:267-1319(+)
MKTVALFVVVLAWFMYQPVRKEESDARAAPSSNIVQREGCAQATQDAGQARAQAAERERQQWQERQERRERQSVPETSKPKPPAFAYARRLDMGNRVTGTITALRMNRTLVYPEVILNSNVPPLGPDWAGYKLASRQARWQELLSHLQFHALPRYTQYGFQLAQTPKHIQEKLSAQLQSHIDNPPRMEAAIDIVKVGDVREAKPPFFIDQPQLNREVLLELQPYLQEWCRCELEPMVAYGLRVYRYGNTLGRHVDRLDTHVISVIVHVGRDEPWPIVIEDHDGVEHAVDLKPGQMLFYESAKQPHHRPTPFTGSYYSSLFVHYRPTNYHVTLADLAPMVPAGWDEGSEEP